MAGEEEKNWFCTKIEIFSSFTNQLRNAIFNIRRESLLVIFYLLVVVVLQIQQTTTSKLKHTTAPQNLAC
jgi:hypothetical protein